MKTIVITGGTDGIGRYLADTYIKRGDRVVVIGRDAEKGRAFRDSAGGSAVFLQADLGELAEIRAVIRTLLVRCPAIDALVLCARSDRSRRAETADGIEATFSTARSRPVICAPAWPLA
jgi:NAD(P)-dependent dehydrogenase (short-subunit alcohol dehydrogenase family)